MQDAASGVYELGKTLFGEGLCPRNADEFVLLTWLEGKIIILDRETLTYKTFFELPSNAKEGWGITAVENKEKGNYMLYMTDSTPKMLVLDG